MKLDVVSTIFRSTIVGWTRSKLTFLFLYPHFFFFSLPASILFLNNRYLFLNDSNNGSIYLVFICHVFFPFPNILKINFWSHPIHYIKIYNSLIIILPCDSFITTKDVGHIFKEPSFSYGIKSQWAFCLDNRFFCVRYETFSIGFESLHIFGSLHLFEALKKNRTRSDSLMNQFPAFDATGGYYRANWGPTFPAS